MTRSAIVLVVTLLLESLTIADDTRWRAVAVIANPSIEDSGISEILTANISKDSQRTVIERGEIKRVLAEFDLFNAVLPTESQTRIRIGRFLKADLLIFLRDVEYDQHRFLQVVISETGLGARLSRKLLATEEYDVLQVAGKCEKLLQTTEQRFRDGVKEVVGVLPFVSKNITHEFMPLQAAYSTLLEETLVQFPGVAVLEIDEALEIERELALAGEDRLKSRPVPGFIHGHYLVRFEDGNQVVDLNVEFRRGNSTRNFVSDNLSQAEVVSLLSRTIPTEVLKSAEDRTDFLTDDEQFEALVRQADALALVGDYARSRSLREAALLIRPDDFVQHVRAIRDYGVASWNRIPLERLRDGKGFVDSKKLRSEEFFDEWIRGMQSSFSHLEFLVKRDLLNVREAGLALNYVLKSSSWIRNQRHPDNGQLGGVVARQLAWPLVESGLQLDPELRAGAVTSVLSSLYYGSFDTDPPEGRSAFQQRDTFIKYCWDILIVSPSVRSGRSIAEKRTIVDDFERLIRAAARIDCYSPSLIQGIINGFDSYQLFRRLPLPGIKEVASRLETGTPNERIYGQWLSIALAREGFVRLPDGEALSEQAQSHWATTEKLIRSSDEFTSDTLTEQSLTFLKRGIERKFPEA